MSQPVAPDPIQFPSDTIELRGQQKSKLDYVRGARFTFNEHDMRRHAVFNDHGEFVNTDDGNGANLVGVMIVATFAITFGFLIGFFVGRM